MKLRKRQEKSRWELKQELAFPSRFYGDEGTIHRTDFIDVETFNGEVVAVWFRCQAIAFRQHEVDLVRATNILDMVAPKITGVEVSDD
jgi:hypothetical protein